MNLSFQPYKVVLKRTPYVAVALFLVQTVSGIREGNEIQVVDESDFNVYVSDAAMSSSEALRGRGKAMEPTNLGICWVAAMWALMSGVGTLALS